MGTACSSAPPRPWPTASPKMTWPWADCTLLSRTSGKSVSRSPLGSPRKHMLREPPPRILNQRTKKHSSPNSFMTTSTQIPVPRSGLGPKECPLEKIKFQEEKQEVLDNYYHKVIMPFCNYSS